MKTDKGRKFAEDEADYIDSQLNPTTTGEWTVEAFYDLGMEEATQVAAQINAALAAEKQREEHDWGHVKREYLRLQKANEKLEQQLDAERSKVKELEARLKEYDEHRSV